MHDDDLRLMTPLRREVSNVSGGSTNSVNSNNSAFNNRGLVSRAGLFRSFTDGHDVSVVNDEDIDEDLDADVDTESIL